MPAPPDLENAILAFSRLLELQNPDMVRYWNPPPALRHEYVKLAEAVVYALDTLRAIETQALHDDATIESRLPRDVIEALRTKVRPREAAIWDALDVLDPENSLLRELMVFQTRPAGRGGSVRSTFQQGVEEVRSLIDRNPDRDFAWLHPDLADSVLESRLLAFEPDAWLDRIAALEPVRTALEGPSLPIGARLRLRELYKVYAYGCWFSVVSAARATLEFALLENAARLNVELPTPRPNEASPSLYKMIRAYETRTPDLAVAMHRIRELGNLSLHTAESTQRGQHAAEAISLIQQVLTALYAR